MTVPATVKSLQSSTAFSDIITAWYAQSTSAFSLVRHSNNGILSPTFTKTSEISHFLFVGRHARLPPPLPPIMGTYGTPPPPTSRSDTFNTPPLKKVRPSPIRVPARKPKAAPPLCHIIDPDSTEPDAWKKILSSSLSQPTGAFQPRKNAVGEFALFSHLCLDYLAGLECAGDVPCGYHLHVDPQSLKHPAKAYQPLCDFFQTHSAIIKSSPAALANPKLFPPSS